MILPDLSRPSWIESLGGPSFGVGRHEPYARALCAGGGLLTLRPASAGDRVGAVDFEVGGWCEEATAEEGALLEGLAGPVLDIGCGPGRLLAAAGVLGLVCMGIDINAEAVRQARGRGVSALRQSVFGAVPYPGQWQTLLLLDGNIGIGGSVTMLLRRCRELVAPSGTLLVEVEDSDVDSSYKAVLEDRDGNASEAFPWARAGRAALLSRALRTGWALRSTLRVQGRVFCFLEPLTLPALSSR
ncbi:methyltransferase domain-containing protein [Arthrobacter sp. NA-172]|uniref:methyltransferase domain-containing protein n=1 Tax=Arthrobacter sp. NA-172 TaxID=3367524 RepID=UPI003754FC19